MPEGWQWDETLFQGSAPYYAQGRLPYAPDLANELAQALELDSRGRLIDVGCGPGILAISLAHLFEEVIGVDPDPGMLIEARERASEAGITNIQWLQSRAEVLPGNLGSFDAATFGQSFHWMDRDLVASMMRSILKPGGAFIQIADLKNVPPVSSAELPFPLPPFSDITALIRRYLGPERRAGQGVLKFGSPGDELAVLKRAGYPDPERLIIPSIPITERSADDIVAWVFSLSGSAPHLFANVASFETELRQLLANSSPTGQFSEPVPPTEVFIWRNP